MLCCLPVTSCISVGVPYAQSCLCPSEMAGTRLWQSKGTMHLCSEKQEVLLLWLWPAGLPLVRFQKCPMASEDCSERREAVLGSWLSTVHSRVWAPACSWPSRQCTYSLCVDTPWEHRLRAQWGASQWTHPPCAHLAQGCGCLYTQQLKAEENFSLLLLDCLGPRWELILKNKRRGFLFKVRSSQNLCFFFYQGKSIPFSISFF